MDAYRVAYDGRPFHGFQRQPDVATVEDALYDALRNLGVLADDADKPAGYAAAGRTDAGVSAVAQTVAFEAPEWLTPAALNSELPAEVRAWAHADVSNTFHATHHADAREYTYFLHAPPEFHAEAARESFSLLCGEHDFHNLTPDDERTVRTISGTLVRDGEFLELTLTAGGFCRQLVRRFVGVIATVGRGEADLAWVERVLSDEALQGPAGVAPAPPYPLVLTGVDYPDISFVPDSDALDSARDLFASRRVEYATRARVFDLIAGRLCV